LSLYRIRTVISGWQGGPGLNTYYFSDGGAPSSADALTVVNRVRGAWDVVKSIMPNTVTAQTLGAVDVLDIPTGVLQTTFSVTQPAVVTGTVAGAIGPGQIAAGLILDTGNILHGRRFKGHSFINPISGTLTTSVSPSVGIGTAVAAMGVALLTVSPPAAVPIMVWHRPVHGAGGSALPAISSSAATKWFSIRSRRD
jgi:hypothetical protein